MAVSTVVSRLQTSS